MRDYQCTNLSCCVIFANIVWMPLASELSNNAGVGKESPGWERRALGGGHPLEQ